MAELNQHFFLKNVDQHCLYYTTFRRDWVSSMGEC